MGKTAAVSVARKRPQVRRRLPNAGVGTSPVRLLRDSALAEAKFRALVESAPDAIVIVDAAGRMVLVNAEAEHLFGYRRERLIGQPVEMLVPERLRDVHRQHRARHAQRARPMGSGPELVALHADGHQIPVEISLSPIETAEGLVVASTIRDLSERKRMEAQARTNAVLEERNRLSREVHDNVAHSLTGVVLQLECADDVLGSDPAQAREYMARARALARSGLEAVRRALLALRSPLLDDADLPSALQRMAHALTTDTRLSVDVSVLGRRQPLAREVEEGLLHIAQEALTNAIRHAEARHIRTELAFGMDAVRLRVADDGHGFSTRTAGAEGLGLAGMRVRAQHMGARLWVRSRPGAGTRLEVRVPVATQAPRA